MKVKLEDLEGKWYVQYTNFPMWLKEENKDPFFKYYIDKKNGKVGLRDTVGYYKDGDFKDIKGFDFPQNPENTKMKWKGSGWLFLARSYWEIKHMGKSKDWMLIYFSKTMFTPEGYDVVTRKSDLDPETKTDILDYLSEHQLLSTLTKVED